MRQVFPLLLLVACGGAIDLDVETPEEVSDVCEKVKPEPVTVEVSFPAVPPGCAWGEDGNLDMAQATVTARSEQFVDLDIPEDSIVCGLGFQFQIDPNVEPIMEYDDNMFLLYNGVVMAASYGPMVDPLPREDNLPIWDWSALRGTEFGFDDVPPYCAGQEEGLSDCTIPPPETRGALLLSYDDALVDRLALRAAQLNQQQFGFITIGDNDPELDCRHEAFSFEVEVPYIER